MKIFLIFLFGIFPLVAVADDKSHHNGGDDTTVVKVDSSNPVSVNHSSRVFAGSGGDMDINDCLATHSILFGLWQGTHTNPFCEADRMDRDGDYLGAAMMRCSTRKYKKVYGKGQSCVDAIILTAPPPPAPLPQVIFEDDDEDYHEELQAQIVELEQQIEEAPKKTIVIDDGAERRAKTRAILKGEE